MLKRIEIREDSIYRDLSDHKEAEGAAYGYLAEAEEIIVDSFLKVSLEDKPYVISSGVSISEVTPLQRRPSLGCYTSH